MPFRLALALSLAAGPAHARPAPDLAGTAATLMGQALATDEPYEELRTLCDTIGHRLSGTPELARAVRWAEAELAADGLETSLEPVEVHRWSRGTEAARYEAPVPGPLPLLALGDSVGTPPEGLVADVLVVDALGTLSEAEAEGRIVVYDVPFTTYGETVKVRYGAASEASRAGAVAALVRSISPVSLSTPHTGNQRYADDVTPIPVAAIPLEDAARMHRLQEAGVTPRVALTLGARQAGTAISHNVVGEVRGRSAPGEVVVLSCHLDSWDVGQGAQDDGAGCVTVMQAGALLAALPRPPRRTVRVVLYTNEENGLAGGKAFAEAHGAERIVAAVEDDSGAGTPLGFRLDVQTDGKRDDTATQAVIDRLLPLLRPLGPVGAHHLEPGFAGADISPLTAMGVVGFGLSHDMTGYWPVHHTAADTFEKIDPTLVRKNVAAMTVLAWVLAEMPGPLRPE